MQRVVALVCNPSAGGGRSARMLPHVESMLRALGARVHTSVTRDLAHARVVARAAASAGEVTAALGGDGLAGCLAGALREVPGSVLGVLPGGRANDFARVLGIPRDLAGACRVVAAGRERSLDVGDVEGRTFVGIASLGFDSDANRIANEASTRLGALVYAYAALRALAGWHPARFTVTLGGETLAFTGYAVAACNSRAYGGGMLLAPDASLDDGLLDVVLTAALSRRRFAASLPKVFRGKHVHEPAVRVLRAAELHVDADRPFVVYADGEPIGRTPVTIRAVPGALRVLVAR